MNYTKLVEDFAKENGLSSPDAKALAKSFLQLIKKGIAEGQVSIKGFGSFKAVKRNERLGRNPITGELIVIPERNAIKFIPSKFLTESVNS